LKAIALPPKQLAQEPFGASAILGTNEIGEAERPRDLRPAAQHLFQRRIQRSDVAAAPALRPGERGIGKKGMQARFRILRRPRNFSSSAHTPTLRGMIPGRNL